VRWLSLPVGLVAAHLLANVVWVGALLSVALLSSRAPFMADASDVGALARRIHLRLAVPAFLASFGAGLARLLLAPRVYAHLPWMQAKLGCALLLIVLHHVIGARAKRIAGGNAASGAGTSLLALVTFAAAGGAVLLGVFKSLP
jgi:putative membrane protein